ncbi:MAG: DUF1365 domain-containing protein [Vicinamibacterales bacterium]
MIEPGLFVGTIRHRRFAPVAHRFVYRTAMALLDIDRLPELMAVSRLTSYDRWNWAAYHERDHLGDPRRPLRERLAAAAAARGLDLPGGRILLLTHLRYLGHVFNPVSFYYAFTPGETLALVVAEVNNTFGGGDTYWLRASGASPTFRAVAAKSLYVSPFLPVDLDYRFAFTVPGDRLAAHMRTERGGVAAMDATLSLTRRPWTAREIRRHLLRHPVMTAEVTAGIHWEALKLWWKGVAVVPRATRDGIGERAARDGAAAEAAPEGVAEGESR